MDLGSVLPACSVSMCRWKVGKRAVRKQRGREGGSRGSGEEEKRNEEEGGRGDEKERMEGQREYLEMFEKRVRRKVSRSLPDLSDVQVWWGACNSYVVSEVVKVASIWLQWGSEHKSNAMNQRQCKASSKDLWLSWTVGTRCGLCFQGALSCSQFTRDRQ